MIQILTHRCFWGKTHLFDFEMREGRDDKWALEQIDKLYNKNYFNPEMAKGELNFTEIPKPDKWPKFSNEEEFKLKWNGGYIHNPKILNVRWGADGWEYQLENIGHKYDFQPENKLSKI